MGITPVPNPYVAVRFGDEPAVRVRVMSTTLLHVTTPIFGGAPKDVGPVDVTVENLAQDGTVLETVVRTAFFTYARPDLKSDAVDTVLTRVVRTVMRELRRQVIDNVKLSVNVDYADSPTGSANAALLAALPGLVLSGPALKENRFYSLNQAREVEVAGEFKQLRPPKTVDLIFTIIGADDDEPRMLNLMHETTAFFNRNKMLRMLADPAVAGVWVEYELEVQPDGDLESTGPVNNSNVRSFSGSFVIRGVDIEDDDMVTEQVFPLEDAIAVNAVGTPDAITLDGDPGVGDNPPAAIGSSGPIYQIPPES